MSQNQIDCFIRDTSDHVHEVVLHHHREESVLHLRQVLLRVRDTMIKDSKSLSNFVYGDQDHHDEEIQDEIMILDRVQNSSERDSEFIRPVNVHTGNGFCMPTIRNHTG